MRRLLNITLALLVVSCSSKKGPTGSVRPPDPPDPPTGPWVLDVRTTAPGARITVDGVLTNYWTPLAFGVAEGDHQIGLSLMGYRDTTVLVARPLDARDTLDVVLGTNPGTPSQVAPWISLPSYPNSMAMLPAGPLWVSSGEGNYQVECYSLDGTRLWSLPMGPNAAINLVARGDGAAFCTQWVNNFGYVVERIAPNGSSSASIFYAGTSSAWPGDLGMPPCPALGTNDSLMVLERYPGMAGDIFRYSGNTYAGRWKTGLTSTRLLQVDKLRRRCFLTDGDSLWIYTTGGHRENAWELPDMRGGVNGFTVPPDGTVWIADGSIIRRYDITGALLAEWSTGGSVAGIHGLAIDAAGEVYVGDYGRQRIVRYRP